MQAASGNHGSGRCKGMRRRRARERKREEEEKTGGSKEKHSVTVTLVEISDMKGSGGRRRALERFLIRTVALEELAHKVAVVPHVTHPEKQGFWNPAAGRRGGYVDEPPSRARRQPHAADSVAGDVVVGKHDG